MLRRGLTLLEVLIAAMLLAIGILGALEVIARGASTARQVEDHSRVLLAARSKMDEILKEPVLELGTDRSDAIAGVSPYEWEAVVGESQNPALVVITVTARNPKTGVEATLTTVRRPDNSSAILPVGRTAAPADPAAQTGAPGGPAAGGGGTP